VDHYGYLPTLVSLVANLLVVFIIFSFAGRIMKLLGEGGAKATAKVISILLASIGVMMMRTGITDLIQTFNM
jgi:multiple antibiotic resistance protein